MFGALLVSFASITALVIFSTLGYRFNFKRGIFIYTGSITVKVTPDTVNILVDGKAVPQKRQNILNQSIHISGIDPGEHLLRVESPGYQSWEKKISIGSGISTEFWNVILPKDSFQPDTLISGPFLHVLPSPDGKFLALFGESGTEATVTIFEKNSKKSEQIFSSKEFRLDKTSAENPEWSPDGKSIVFPLSNGLTREYLTVNRETLVTENISDRIGLPDTRLVRWNPKETTSLLFLSGDSLHSLDVSGVTKEPVLIGDGIATYDLSKDAIIYLDRESGIIYQSDYGELNPDPITQPALIPFTDPTLVSYDKDRIALFEKGGRGILFNQGELNAESSFFPLGEGIRSVQFSDDGKKLLFATDNEISVLFTRDWDVQPSRKEGNVFQIARLSKPVSSVQWTEDYEHILFATEGSLRMAELDHRDHRNIFTLDTALDPLQILSDFRDNTIIIIDRHDGSTSLLSFVFPKPATFFGN
jgi:dipeptidyl aminopeptidase/acylaminoacyl peptidase